MTEQDLIPPNDIRLSKAYGHIEGMLVPNETIQAYAVQRRLFALRHRRQLVVASSGRFIGISRGLLGGFSPIDIRWQDLKSVHIKAGIFASSLFLSYLSSPDLAIQGQLHAVVFKGLRKQQALEIYRICQQQEQIWREKRRQRELEEMRAKSGGISGLNAYSETQSSAPNRTERLKTAKELLDSGLISDSEYETIKAKIINNL
jgi:hypothetical protein